MSDTEPSVYDDDYYGTILDEIAVGRGWRTARKLYCCWECSRQIDTGERYFHLAVLSDGLVTSWRVCSHCYDERNP
jgi:predicted GNAT superfamily acetyltransferase